MSLNTQFSLSLELAKILPIREAVSYTAESLVQLVRSLKASGSDFLIEEDLAAIFGRGRIVPELEQNFRAAVRINSITPLYSGSEVVLNAGPGPTVGRALKDRHYMASVIQLSFLTWMHEKTSLAATLVECMRIRYEKNTPGSTPEPAHDDVLKTLEVCSSQISLFHWDTIVEHVKSRLVKSVDAFQYEAWKSSQPNAAMFLPAKILLGAMDYLYLVQSLPEDRFILIGCPRGVVPFIVWAHFILGLSLLVEGSPDGDVKFGDCRRPHVVIKWSEINPYDDSSMRDQLQVIYLMDGKEEVVLENNDTDNKYMRIDGQEKHRLKGFGTYFLQRSSGRFELQVDEDLLCTETATYAISYAVALSSQLRRVLLKTVEDDRPSERIFLDIDKWRLLQSAKLLFTGLELDENRISAIAKEVPTLKRSDIKFPAVMDSRIKDSYELRGLFYHQIEFLSSWVLAFGQVENIENCAELPLVIKFPRSAIIPGVYLYDLKPTDISHDVWMKLIVCLMDGAPNANISERSNSVFLESRNGWSVFFSSVGDRDPEETSWELVSIKHRVPTNRRTNERKYRIADASGIHTNVLKPVHIPENMLRYLPNHAIKINQRVEHWTSRRDEFWLSIRFDVEYQRLERFRRDNDLEDRVSVYGSYGGYHEALWGVLKSTPCSHKERPVISTPFKDDMKMSVGIQWSSISLRSEPRIQIALLQGHARARWLVVHSLCRDYLRGYPLPDGRHVMLRCESCCDNCAIKAASEMYGSWLVVL